MEGRLKISLAQWSLHRAILSGALDPLDFPAVARRDCGIDSVELVSQLLGSPRRETIAALGRRARGEGVRILLIMVDDEGDLSHAKDLVRKKAARNHRKWIDAAHDLGCAAVRVNTGGRRGDPHAVRRCAGSAADLADYARPAGIRVLFENHGGVSTDAGALVQVCELSGRENVGTLPDFGNFPRDVDIYDAVARMMPRAGAVSAKSFDFDAAGNETTIDFARMIEIVRRAGYSGWLGIEYEGSRLPELEGILKTKALLERLIS